MNLLILMTHIEYWVNIGSGSLVDLHGPAPFPGQDSICRLDFSSPPHAGCSLINGTHRSSEGTSVVFLLSEDLLTCVARVAGLC